MKEKDDLTLNDLDNASGGSQESSPSTICPECGTLYNSPTCPVCDGTVKPQTGKG